MIRPAPAIRAALIAARPTPPQPITATVSPGTSLQALKMVPAPVVTAQPITAARSSGMSRSIATQACSWTSIASAKPERLSIWLIGASVLGGDPRRGAAGAAGVAAGAERHPPGHAIFAMAAEGGEAGDDMVADLDGADLASDRLDHAGGLVAGDAGEGVGVGALDEVEVANGTGRRRRCG